MTTDITTVHRAKYSASPTDVPRCVPLPGPGLDGEGDGDLLLLAAGARQRDQVVGVAVPHLHTDYHGTVKYVDGRCDYNLQVLGFLLPGGVIEA